MFIGAHVSTAGGLMHAPENGIRLGCEAIQVFTRNQMQWNAKPLSDIEVEGFRKALRTSRIRMVLSHSSYLINLGGPEEAKLMQSRVSFEDEINRCDQLGIPYLVFHPGAHMGAGVKAGLHTIIESINDVLKEKKGSKTQLLLETTAGQGSNLGCTFEQLAEILEGVREKSRVGICVDSCHIFAAGYDLRTRAKYEATMRSLEEIVGLRQVKAIHLNDSEKQLGSKVDRHAQIGKGCLGLQPFGFILNDERFYGLPMVIEIPGGPEDYRRNLQLLKKIRKLKVRCKVSAAGRP